MQKDKLDRIDKIRNNFFDKLKKEEEEKQREICIRQSLCLHTFITWSRPSADGKYQRFRCTKCDYRCTKKREQCNLM
jgi:hypothetical protein